MILSFSASAQDWLPTWESRRPMSIANFNYKAMIDYQARIEVDFTSGMQNDFSDVRFTSGDGTTVLPYWIQYIEESTTSVFWVKLDSIDAFKTADFFMYYGNDFVESEADPNETFIFYDDFSQNTGWNLIGSDTTTSIVTENDLTLLKKFDGCENSGTWKSLSDTIPTFKLISKERTPNYSQDSCTLMSYGIESSAFDGFNLRRDGYGIGIPTEFGLHRQQGSEVSGINTLLVNQPLNAWYFTEVSYCFICNMNVHAQIRNDSMGILGNAFDFNYETFEFSNFTLRGGNTLTMDYIAVAQKLCVEPVLFIAPEDETCAAGNIIAFDHDYCEEGLGSISLNVSGGVPPYIIDFYNGQDSINSFTLDTVGVLSIDSLGAGQYCFKVFDSNGCGN